jgi:exodeoxyribonuclease VIII
LIGLWSGVPNEAYHRGPGLSCSGLKAFAVSASYYHVTRTARQHETDSRRELKLIHMIVLEPKRFDDEVEVIDGSRNSNAVKDQIAAAHAKGKVVCKSEELERFRNIARSVRNHPDSGPLMSTGQGEVSIYWKDPETGVLCKARPDWLRPDWVIVDLKSCGSMIADERKLRWHLNDQRYHWQSGWYLDGVKVLSGRSQRDFAHCFIDERDCWIDRHPIETRVLGDASLEKARSEYRPLVSEYAKRLASDDWRGIQDIELPDNAW